MSEQPEKSPMDRREAMKTFGAAVIAGAAAASSTESAEAKDADGVTTQPPLRNPYGGGPGTGVSLPTQAGTCIMVELGNGQNFFL